MSTVRLTMSHMCALQAVERVARFYYLDTRQGRTNEGKRVLYTDYNEIIRYQWAHVTIKTKKGILRGCPSQSLKMKGRMLLIRGHLEGGIGWFPAEAEYLTYNPYHNSIDFNWASEYLEVTLLHPNEKVEVRLDGDISCYLYENEYQRRLAVLKGLAEESVTA